MLTAYGQRRLPAFAAELLTSQCVPDPLPERLVSHKCINNVQPLPDGNRVNQGSLEPRL